MSNTCLIPTVLTSQYILIHTIYSQPLHLTCQVHVTVWHAAPSSRLILEEKQTGTLMSKVLCMSDQSKQSLAAQFFSKLIPRALPTATSSSSQSTNLPSMISPNRSKPTHMPTLLPTTIDVMNDGPTTLSDVTILVSDVMSVLIQDEQIEGLRMQAFNNMCSIIFQNCQIESWKRFALAISKTDIQCLQSLMPAALRDGSGVYRLLERVDKVAQHVYLAKGYQKADFKQAFMMWKLVGRSAANIA
jgi:hypothetical protein